MFTEVQRSCGVVEAPTWRMPFSLALLAEYLVRCYKDVIFFPAEAPGLSIRSLRGGGVVLAMSSWTKYLVCDSGSNFCNDAV